MQDFDEALPRLGSGEMGSGRMLVAAAALTEASEKGAFDLSAICAWMYFCT